MMDKVMMFVDSHHGIYAPQSFAQYIDLDKVELLGINPDDLEVLKEGPEHVEYWEAWNIVEQNVRVKDKATGQTFTIYQDEDIWLIDETAKAGKDHHFWEPEN